MTELSNLAKTIKNRQAPEKAWKEGGTQVEEQALYAFGNLCVESR